MMLLYSRVSSEDQARPNRNSMRDQERILKGIAMTRGVSGFDIALYQDPGVSGAMPLADRPGGKAMLEAAQKGDTICAVKLDRMFRSASDALVTAESLKARGIHLILFDLGPDPVTGDGMSKFFFTMVGAFAELERVKIAERMQGGRDSKKARGGHIGGEAPWGYRKTGKGRDAVLIPDPEEQDVLAMARRMRQFRNPNKVATELNELGIRTRLGGPIQRIQVVRMMKREAVNGFAG